jgi:ribosomal subunit interface protein
MRVIVQSKTIEVTSALRAFIRQQVMKIIGRNRKISCVTVFLETIKRRKNDDKSMIVKLVIEVPRKPIVVERRAEDMYKAVVEVTRRAARYLRKRKERRIDRTRNGFRIQPWSLNMG